MKISHIIKPRTTNAAQIWHNRSSGSTDCPRSAQLLSLAHTGPPTSQLASRKKERHGARRLAPLADSNSQGTGNGCMHLRTYPLLLVLSPDPRVQDAAMAISPSFALHRPLSRAVSSNTDYTSNTFRATFIQAMPRPRCSLSPQGSGACPTKPGLAHYCVQQTDHRGTFFTDAHFKELIPSLSWMEIHGVRPARLAVPYQRQKGNLLDALESMAYPYEYTTKAQTL